MISTLPVDSARVWAEIDELAAISETPLPAVTRVLFSDRDLEARAWIERKCLDLGLQVRRDCVGNFFARWEGSEPALAAVATGSHIDAIPNAGRYDGVVGVLGAPALARTGRIHRRGTDPLWLGLPRQPAPLRNSSH
jgi:ureidoglycolate amidohydrolase